MVVHKLRRTGACTVFRNVYITHHEIFKQHPPLDSHVDTVPNNWVKVVSFLIWHIAIFALYALTPKYAFKVTQSFSNPKRSPTLSRLLTKIANKRRQLTSCTQMYTAVILKAMNPFVSLDTFELKRQVWIYWRKKQTTTGKWETTFLWSCPIVLNLFLSWMRLFFVACYDPLRRKHWPNTTTNGGGCDARPRRRWHGYADDEGRRDNGNGHRRPLQDSNLNLYNCSRCSHYYLTMSLRTNGQRM